MLTKDQAMQLKEAGLTAYNHNLDTSREFYPQVRCSWDHYERRRTAQFVSSNQRHAFFHWIFFYPMQCNSVATHYLTECLLYWLQVITTRSYDDRLRTIANVREAGLSVCSGGILGLGEVCAVPTHTPYSITWLTGWLADWLADWLTDWLIDWLTNWLTDSLTDILTRPGTPRQSEFTVSTGYDGTPSRVRAHQCTRCGRRSVWA